MDIQIDTLGYYVDRVFSCMVKFLNDKLAECGLEFQHPHFAILIVLSKKDGLDQSALTEFIHRDKAAVSRNIKYLEEKGYVVRRFEGGKKKKVFLTEKSRRVIPVLYDIAAQDTTTTLKGFSESQKKSVYKMLTKMYENISSATRN